MRTLNGITAQRGLPRTIKTDNGSEFISKAMEKWAYERGVELDLQPTGQAHGQRRRRKLQREIASRVPERTLVLVIDRCPGQD